MDDFDSLFDELSSQTEGEKLEMVLVYLNAELTGMDDATLRAFRARVVQMHPGTAEQTTLLEVVDGLLALRAIEGMAS